MTMAGPHSFFGSGTGCISAPQASLQKAWAFRFMFVQCACPLFLGARLPLEAWAESSAGDRGLCPVCSFWSGPCADTV